MTKISSDKRRLSLGVATAIVLVAATVPGLRDPKQDEVFTQVDAFSIPGGALASFDISWVDPVLKKYYLGDRSNKAVDVINTATKAVTQFKPTSPTATGFVGFTGNNNTSGPDGVMTIEISSFGLGMNEQSLGATRKPAPR